jgi:Tol biopolymer transport system component
VAWDEPIGNYDWSPEGSRIAFDRLTYAATGEERIVIRERQGGQEQPVSPDFPGDAFAFYPVFSPQGRRIAYLAALGGPDHATFNLYVQELAGGEPRDLGVFEHSWALQWTPDGDYLVLSAGPYEARQVFLVRVSDGAVTSLTQGQGP